MKAKACNGIPTEEKYVDAPKVYLHGEIEKDCKFDCVVFTDCDTIYSKEWKCEYAKLYKGFRHIEVIGSNPEREPILFVWETNPNNNFGYPWMGLIVYLDDKEAFNYACKCYKEHRKAI